LGKAMLALKDMVVGWLTESAGIEISTVYYYMRAWIYMSDDSECQKKTFAQLSVWYTPVEPHGHRPRHILPLSQLPWGWSIMAKDKPGNRNRKGLEEGKHWRPVTCEVTEGRSGRIDTKFRIRLFSAMMHDPNTRFYLGNCYPEAYIHFFNSYRPGFSR